MPPCPARLRWLLSPWTWVLAAAVLRLGLLLSLPVTAPRLAISVDAQTVKSSLPSSRLEFLQSRVQLAPLTEDERAYDEIARNLVTGRGFVLDSKWLITTPGKPTMYAGFTYPAFVAAVYSVFGSGQQVPLFLVQILLAALAARWIVTSAARVGGAVAGAIAGAFYAFHPTLIWSSVAMMSESISVPLVAVLMWLLARRSSRVWRRVLVLAALMALLSLARSTFGYLTWIVAGLLVFEARKRPSWLQRLSLAFVFLVAFTAFCAPWTIRNYVHWKRIIPFSTKSGVAAWMHNHPGLEVEFGPRAVSGPQPIDIFDPRIQNLPDEGTREAKLTEMFWHFVASDPLKFLGLVWMRFWMAVLPVAVVSKSAFAAAAAWYSKGAVLVVLFLSIWFVRVALLWRMLPWVVFAGYWILMQSLAGAGLRYRIPAEPAWACIVGILCAAILVSPRRGTIPLGAMK